MGYALYQSSCGHPPLLTILSKTDADSISLISLFTSSSLFLLVIRELTNIT